MLTEGENMQEKKIFNHKSRERFEECKIIGGNPNGIINYTKTKHQWATLAYKKMLARTWFPEQVNVSKDKTNYHTLTEQEKRAYDLILAQLIANDSIQTNQLMDKINCYITSPVVNACLSRQTFEESLHSESYAVMAEDICQDTDRIYYMHEHDQELEHKNVAVEYMYSSIYQDGKDITPEDLLLAFVANVILEELVFPCGFVVMFSLSSKMPGSAEMIREIAKDEVGHVHLFRSIYRTAIEESFNKVVPDLIKNSARELIMKLTEAEKRWGKYVTNGLLGFSPNVIDRFVESRANDVCKNINIDPIYEESKINPLNTIYLNNLRGGELESRTNFFESNSTEYSTGAVEVDF